MTFERSLCFMQILARSKKVKDSALKSIFFFFFQESVTYIHESTFAPHVGTSNSFHQWRKKILEAIISGLPEQG